MKNRTTGYLIFVGFLVAAMINPGFLAYGQLNCNPEEPAEVKKGWVNRPLNAWTGYVFQLDPAYIPQNDYKYNFLPDAANGNRVYKGFLLKDDNHFLPTNSLNFDTEFSSIDNNGLDEDLDFFPTGTSSTVTGGCDTQLSHFGVLLKSKTTIQEPGIYRLTLGSDDGSYFRMYKDGNFSDLVSDVNGNPLLHDNWYKDGSDGVYNFVYGDNIRNYYLPFEGGENLWMDFNFYEKSGNNRLSFNFELYFGPGEIGIPTNPNPGLNDYLETGSASYCGIAPDPMVLKSRGPAQFAEGSDPTYQWQYALVNDSDDAFWTDIAGATDLDYDIAQYDENGNDENNWTGTRYYRRKAFNTATDAEGEIIVNEFASNILEINLSVIEDMDQSEYGDQEWIGHIYQDIRNFDSQNYLGRYVENQNFNQNFGEASWKLSNQNTFTPDHGCAFLTDKFTVAYKMKMTAEPGNYQFSVNGDDGYRLKINGSTVINEWAKIGGVKESADTYDLEVTEEMELFLELDYYENTQGQRIEFNYTFTSIILPLTWGKIQGNVCGNNNCVNWETLQEKNTDFFIVERSVNGTDWTSMDGKIDAMGKSNALTQYDFTDVNFQSTRTYYRVKQVDHDGAYSYSETIRVDHADRNLNLLPYPNPTAGILHLYASEEVSAVHIISQDQRVSKVISFDKTDDHRYKLDLGSLPENNYLVTVITPSGKKTYKIMKR
ncbi:MAG: PA14 domain-containing protein [Cyclobacteriaceae bacterium]